jgi:catechol 2,3-dioxygenase-like lactoylglutathione lyase family enzyme
MDIEHLDHLVITVRDIKTSCDFYRRLLGMNIIEFAGNRKALVFGRQKLNLHQYGSEFKPHARYPTPGSADLCFLTSMPIDEIVKHCRENNVDILEGPVRRTGATGALLSVYLRDPDGNLIEIASPLPDANAK